MIEAWRLFRVGKDFAPQTLFHGVQGSKKIEFDKLYEADIKEVSNPGKTNGLTFTSGFHVLPTKEELLEYKKRFTATDIRVCKVYVDGFRDKPRSKSKLSNEMLVLKNDWIEALELKASIT